MININNNRNYIPHNWCFLRTEASPPGVATEVVAKSSRPKSSAETSVIFRYI